MRLAILSPDDSRFATRGLNVSSNNSSVVLGQVVLATTSQSCMCDTSSCWKAQHIKGSAHLEKYPLARPVKRWVTCQAQGRTVPFKSNQCIRDSIVRLLTYPYLVNLH